MMAIFSNFTTSKSARFSRQNRANKTAVEPRPSSDPVVSLVNLYFVYSSHRVSTHATPSTFAVIDYVTYDSSYRSLAKTLKRFILAFCVGISNISGAPALK
jgi:hypothetical protein